LGESNAALIRNRNERSPSIADSAFPAPRSPPAESRISAHGEN
jgi:hypothetical protein